MIDGLHERTREKVKECRDVLRRFIRRSRTEDVAALAVQFIDEATGPDQAIGLRAEFAFIGLSMVWLEIMDEEAEAAKRRRPWWRFW